MATYTLRDEGAELVIEAETLAEVRERAEEWTREVDWDTSGGTVYVDVSVIDEDGDYVETVTTAIHQPEPRCASGYEHDWESPHWLVGGLESNPGVWGHGGGIVINEACLRCGCRRRTDTWAQRRDTGEQGLTEVTYQCDHYDVPRFARLITQDEIEAAEDADACAEAVEWLREAPRTIGDLYDHDRDWYEWAMTRMDRLTGGRLAA